MAPIFLLTISGQWFYTIKILRLVTSNSEVIIPLVVKSYVHIFLATPTVGQMLQHFFAEKMMFLRLCFRMAVECVQTGVYHVLKS